MRKIVYVTGTRAEYGLMKETLAEIDKHPELELSLVVCGMHLSEKHGYTIKEIEQDPFNIGAVIKTQEDESSGEEMARFLGKCIVEMSYTFKALKPDIVLLEGDRGEMLAAAITAAHMNIPVAHTSGGDVTGTTIDESIRHAITKFAHIHFPGTAKSAERIKKMGEDDWRIHMVGTVGAHQEITVEQQSEVIQKYKINQDKPFYIVIQHPLTTQPDLAGEQMEETMKAIIQLQEQTILIHPNSDAGSAAIIDVIEKTKSPLISSYKNIPRQEFMALLSLASVMIGNSSAGIVEAPLFNLPVINIGTRQQGRERASNVIDVDHNEEQIVQAIKKATYDSEWKKGIKQGDNPYCDENTASKIANILATVGVSEKLLQKKIAY